MKFITRLFETMLPQVFSDSEEKKILLQILRSLRGFSKSQWDLIERQVMQKKLIKKGKISSYLIFGAALEQQIGSLLKFNKK